MEPSSGCQEARPRHNQTPGEGSGTVPARNRCALLFFCAWFAVSPTQPNRYRGLKQNAASGRPLKTRRSGEFRVGLAGRRENARGCCEDVPVIFTVVVIFFRLWVWLVLLLAKHTVSCAAMPRVAAFVCLVGSAFCFLFFVFSSRGLQETALCCCHTKGWKIYLNQTTTEHLPLACHMHPPWPSDLFLGDLVYLRVLGATCSARNMRKDGRSSHFSRAGLGSCVYIRVYGSQVCAVCQFTLPGVAKPACFFC